MVYYNNNYLDTPEGILHTSDRAFRYGDGLFESCLIADGKIPLMSLHVNRLLKGMGILGIDIPEYFMPGYFHAIFQELAKHHGLQSARGKITIWRSGEGFYLPTSNAPKLLVEIFPLSNGPFVPDTVNGRLGIFREIPRVMHPLSSVKTMNALPYVLAANYASGNGWDDVLLLNTEGAIADSVNSNVWILRNGQLQTTNSANGGVEGTMQAWLLDNASAFGLHAERTNLLPDDLEQAEAIFLTNAIQGIKPVTRFLNRSFENKFPVQLLQDIRQMLI